MDILKLRFEYCYGIKKLVKDDFDFTGTKDNERHIAIYAANGMMKSSFANSFADFKNGKIPQDKLFPSKNTICDITNKKNIGIDPDEIYIIDPYKIKDDTRGISTLLTDNNKRKEYDSIHKKIIMAKENFLKKVSVSANLNVEDTEKCILDDFSVKKIYDMLEEINSQIINDDTKFKDVNYATIFNNNVKPILNDPNMQKNLKDYICQYNSLLENSQYLTSEFDYSRATTVSTTLKNQKFFDAKHSVNLFDGSDDQKINNVTNFNKTFKKELDSLSQNVKDWLDINKQFKNPALREFRKYLADNPNLLSELIDLNKFSKSVWYSYFTEHKQDFNELFYEYNLRINKLENIRNEIEKTKNDWNNIVDLFNQRFHVPFTVYIENQSEVILDGKTPIIKFQQHNRDQNQTVTMDKDEIISKDYLSTGEQRALYVLDILYDIHARIKKQQKTLLIIDDIADSFDYKNKYVLIKYIEEISKSPLFNLIILTHNFDFLRLISKRIVVPEKCFFAYKTHDDEIILKNWNVLLYNPFKHWRNKLRTNYDEKLVIACIPFIRNLIEYSDGNDCYFKTLSSVLHYKKNTENITLNNLIPIFKEYGFKTSNFIPVDTKIIKLINSTCNACLNDSEGINFENKIILSIGIKLLAEKYMLLKDNTMIKFDDKTTGMKINYYIEHNSTDIIGKEILNDVQLIVTENIHLNSFMYEPILDISDNDLRKLYKKVCDLLT